MSTEVIGSALAGNEPRLRGETFVTGRARYISDINPPGTVHMSVLRSPHAHALCLGVDLSSVRSDARCLAALNGAEVRELAGPVPHFVDPIVLGGRPLRVWPLAAGKVVYEGQPVAAVVAPTRGDADALLDLIHVEYELLPPVVDADDALQSGAPLLYDDQDWPDNVVMRIRFAAGDYEAAAAAAPHRLDDTLHIQRYSTQPLEPRGYLASWDDQEERLTFHGSSQNPHPLRWSLATALRLAETQVRVIVPKLGGSFGLKMHGHPEEVLTAVFSRLLGRPVKWIEERDETLLVGGREYAHRFSIAFDDDGKLLAFRDRFVANVGALSACPGWPMAYLSALTFPTGYRISVTDVEGVAVATNKGPWNASRGYGKEAAQVVMERVLDLVARRLGIDPIEVRRRNLIRRHEFPYRTNSGLNIDSGDYHTMLEKARDLIGYDEFRAEQGDERSDIRRGIGIAFELTPEAGGGIPGSFIGGYDTATVRVDPSGGVTVLTGVLAPGNGSDTGIGQIVAGTLGVPLTSISVVQGDTDACPFGFGTYSGRSMVVGGNAARLAALKVRERLIAVAAEELGVDPSDVSLGDGCAQAGGRSVGIAELALTTYTNALRIGAPPLEATETYFPDNLAHKYPTFSNAVHAAIVSVDSATGQVTLDRYGVAHDCGIMINPALVEGQMHGAVAMGIGAALSEEQRYTPDGRLLTDRFKTYLLTRSVDLPDIVIEHHVTPSPFTLLGVKGAGEAGVGGAHAAILNAVNDAIAPLGGVLRTSPASAPNVLAAILSAK